MAGILAPTTTLTLSEPSVSTDMYGDEAETFVSRESGVPAHLAERRRRIQDQTDSRKLVTARTTEAIIPTRGTPVSRGWRVTDERSGTNYLVEHVEIPRSSAMGSNLTHLELSDIA